MYRNLFSGLMLSAISFLLLAPVGQVIAYDDLPGCRNYEPPFKGYSYQPRSHFYSPVDECNYDEPRGYCEKYDYRDTYDYRERCNSRSRRMIDRYRYEYRRGFSDDRQYPLRDRVAPRPRGEFVPTDDIIDSGQDQFFEPEFNPAPPIPPQEENLPQLEPLNLEIEPPVEPAPKLPVLTPPLTTGLVSNGSRSLLF